MKWLENLGGRLIVKRVVVPIVVAAVVTGVLALDPILGGELLPRLCGSN